MGPTTFSSMHSRNCCGFIFLNKSLSKRIQSLRAHCLRQHKSSLLWRLSIIFRMFWDFNFSTHCGLSKRKHKCLLPRRLLSVNSWISISNIFKLGNTDDTTLCSLPFAVGLWECEQRWLVDREATAYRAQLPHRPIRPRSWTLC